VRYGITSLPAALADPNRLLQLSRGHWGIENGLHYRRDATMLEDHAQLRMEREGIIKGYTALLNPEKVGRGLAAFVRVRTQTPEYDSDVFERFIQEEEQIVECHDVDGEDCYILKVRTASTQSLQKLLEKIRSFPGITRTVTTIALETLKEEGKVRPVVNGDKPEEV
jgi:DNA-binding Lrp family transcriptional regulator